jgi:maltose alpha-D-glucosyltransferase/alpha-amylase
MMEQRPDWYMDAILYEVHVRAFHDTVGDGYGNFSGLTRKLDYLEDLGITAIWLLPFYPSPLRDDGYDITDYTSIHPQYGTLSDFKEFLQAAHQRGLRVITELVLNHTSDQHPWFQRARRAPRGSVERDFYVWSDNPDKYAGVRIIFQDFEPSNWTWDHVAGQYYWHRFYHHQPDLNFDNPAVWEALFPVVDFWFGLGVDGMRLDAIPYLFEREGTTCENLPETHQFLKALRKHVDERFPGRMFLAEANQWPEDAVPFFGNGDECHMAFHFPLMPRLFVALHEENSFPIVDILAQTPAIPAGCQWCLFLRNHDELTLEMVTDEERDYMYRAYTRERRARINVGIRHRLAPLLRNDRRRIELLNALLFSLPGSPVVYYGDEIGMGDNIYLGDRNGVRTPMQWSADRNAGFSRANSQKLYLPVVIDPEYHYEAINVEAQQNNPSSLLWWMKRLLALRKRHRAFSRGALEILRPDNPRVLAFLRKDESEQILVVANLSRFVQPVRLDLRAWSGYQPEELFGRTAFPTITEQPYFLTLGPHGFFWFSLTRPRPVPLRNATTSPNARSLPVLEGSRPLAERFEPANWAILERLLPDYLERRHLLPATDALRAVRVQHVGQILDAEVEIWFLVVRVDFRSGSGETLAMPLSFVPEGRQGDLLLPVERAGFARVVGGDGAGVLCQALAVPACSRALLRTILEGRSRNVGGQEIVATPLHPLPPIPERLDDLPLTVTQGERNNLSLDYGSSFFLKAFRRVEDGVNPDLEVGRFLARQPDFTGAAPVVGSLEYRPTRGEPSTLAVLHRYIPHRGTAWQLTLDHLSRFFERVAALSREQGVTPPSPEILVNATATMHQDHREELLGGFPEVARQLGQRTAALHRALSADPADPAFAPEPFGKFSQRSLYQSLRNLTERICRALVRAQLAGPAGEAAEELIRQREQILQQARSLLDVSFGGSRIRCHGDYHLGRLLHTGREFIISDFEGDSTRPLGERRIKRPPLCDVVSMLWSFENALQGALLGLTRARGGSPGMIRPEDRAILDPWARAWWNRIAAEFTTAYYTTVSDLKLIPSQEERRTGLFRILLLEQVLQEIEVELTTRPDWVIIPLQGVLRLLRDSKG